MADYLDYPANVPTAPGHYHVRIRDFDGSFEDVMLYWTGTGWSNDGVNVDGTLDVVKWRSNS